MMYIIVVFVWFMNNVRFFVKWSDRICMKTEKYLSNKKANLKIGQ